MEIVLIVVSVAAIAAWKMTDKATPSG